MNEYFLKANCTLNSTGSLQPNSCWIVQFLLFRSHFEVCFSLEIHNHVLLEVTLRPRFLL
jgi:hypothetical protein